MTISRFSTSLLVLLLTGTLSGCFGNSAQSRITSDYVQTVKSVGVVSLLGPGVNVSYLAPSAQESAFAAVTPDGWNTDRLALEAIVPRLRRQGFSVTTLARTAALNEARDSDWRSPLANSIAEEAYAVGAAHGLDVVVVVQAQVDEDFVTGTNQRVRGFGLQRAFDTGPFIYATVFVEAYDIKNRFAVGRAGGRTFEAATESLWDPAFDTRGDTPAFSADQNTRLAASLAAMLKTTINIAAQEAGL